MKMYILITIFPRTDVLICIESFRNFFRVISIYTVLQSKSIKFIATFRDKKKGGMKNLNVFIIRLLSVFPVWVKNLNF